LSKSLLSNPRAESSWSPETDAVKKTRKDRSRQKFRGAESMEFITSTLVRSDRKTYKVSIRALLPGWLKALNNLLVAVQKTALKQGLCLSFFWRLV
jgi:hypothetical protein